MIEILANRIADWCLRNSETDGDHEVIAYGLECRIADFLQVLVLILAGIALCRPLEMLCCCVCFTSLKQTVGGYHASSHFWCIISFTGLSIGLVLVSAIIPQPQKFLLVTIVLAIKIAIIFCVRPVPHFNHPKSDTATLKSHRKGKQIVLFQAGLILVAAIMFPSYSFWLAGAFGGFFAALSLYISSRKEEKS